jgi:hypothetical protein
MNKAITLLCAILSTIAAGGCQTSSGDGSGGDPDVVYVSEQLSSEAFYHIDLTRNDAVFFLAPNLDVARLTVTCPTGPTYSFANYVGLRIQPTGMAYDPATSALFLTNGVISKTSLPPVVQALTAEGSGMPRENAAACCTDDRNGVEDCSKCSGFPIKEL